MDIVQTKRIQYTPSAFARSSLLHLTETGSLIALQPHTNKRENLGGYLLLVVNGGTGTVKVGSKEYAMRQGDAAFIDCSKPYSHSTIDDLWAISWAHFNGPSLSLIYGKFLERSGKKPVFQSRNPSLYTENLRQLYNIASEDSYIRDVRINTKLSSLLELIMQDCWNDEKGHFSERINLDAVKEYIDQHYSEHLSLEALSNRFYIEKTYLSRAFKLQFGINLFDYLYLIRINRVKELLRFGEDGTGLKLAEIAEKTGFSSESYLSLRFKKTEGCTPSEYRNKWR